ncbi:MAG: mechanosensitive ion channel [Candidatus Adiutrix sp.]|jgi:small-conductance mechanosensitive channel|nr:mechanosensitive ion channel [Candidatus Adiutrix sp.]
MCALLHRLGAAFLYFLLISVWLGGLAQADNGGGGPGAQADQPTAPAAEAEADPWKTVWAGQSGMLDEINLKAESLKAKAVELTSGLNEKTRPYEEEGQRLLVLANTFKAWPNSLEAVRGRIISATLKSQQVLEPVMQARGEVETLFTRVQRLSENLPEEMRRGDSSAEMQNYIKNIDLAQASLATILARYDNALAPFQAMLGRLQTTRDSIGESLPLLWTDYYIHGPVHWLSPDNWGKIPQQMGYFTQIMRLRLPVEMPVTRVQWSTACLRFVLSLGFTCILASLLRRRLKVESDPAGRHIFRVSLPCLCLGLSLVCGSLSETGDFFRLPLSLGNLFILGGQIFLAWDLRLLQYPDHILTRSPFWRLTLPTFCAYALLYLPLTKLLTLFIWLVLIIVCLAAAHGRKGRATALTFENSALEWENVILWIGLGLTLTGLHTYSMALSMFYFSVSLALQLCFGGIALIGRINEILTQEENGSAISRLLLALIAPMALAVAVASVLLWICTLPGGLDMLRHYGLQGMNVGATRFNLIHVILILSAFYITRIAVDIGSSFLDRLPRQNPHIDATLIPPLQTALTYALWCVFSLFALRSLGMGLSNLAMVAGGLSVGIGFGMQTIVNNFISGLILIFSRTLQAGDVVEVGGTAGVVRKISVRATMVETYDNALIFVPNSEFVSSRLVNWTRNNRSARCQIKIGVAYDSDVKTVMQLLLDIAGKHPHVLNKPAPSVIFTDFGPNALDFVLRIWIRDYDLIATASSDIRQEVDTEFRAQGIEIAFPQLDVHVKELPGSVRPGPQPE